ncbi:hypothetical protein [Streptomyces sp. NPDC054838]
MPWERAESPQLPQGVAHAYDVAYGYSADGFGATLCGLAHEGLGLVSSWTEDLAGGVV